MNPDKEYEIKSKVEKFVKEFIGDLDQIQRFVSFLDLCPESKEELQKAIDILNKKEKKMRNFRTLKDVKKTLKLKKLLNDIQ